MGASESQEARPEEPSPDADDDESE